MPSLWTPQGAADIQKFSDKSDIASYAVEGVAFMVKEGIVNGNGDTLTPRINATRAEAAVIMYRIQHFADFP
nr:S-layer homology domain-containing protein [Paenibacillus donghaensis]